jgi:RNA polymerase sigma-70 factor (ECF subfamily)
VRGAAPETDPDLAEQHRLVDAFLAASRGGDFEALVAVLHPDAVFRLRGGSLEPVTVHGAEDVARTVLARGSRLAPLARPAIVNGAAGALVGSPEAPVSVVAFGVREGRIVSLDVLVSPKLR